jgi:hypothetical protein
VIILPFFVTGSPRPFPFPTGVGAISARKSLLESNAYSADPEYREAMLRDKARQSSIFEDARGLSAQPAGHLRKRRAKVSRKKAVKSS